VSISVHQLRERSGLVPFGGIQRRFDDRKVVFALLAVQPLFPIHELGRNVEAVRD